MELILSPEILILLFVVLGVQTLALIIVSTAYKRLRKATKRTHPTIIHSTNKHSLSSHNEASYNQSGKDEIWIPKSVKSHAVSSNSSDPLKTGTHDVAQQIPTKVECTASRSNDDSQPSCIRRGTSLGSGRLDDPHPQSSRSLPSEESFSKSDERRPADNPGVGPNRCRTSPNDLHTLKKKSSSRAASTFINYQQGYSDVIKATSGHIRTGAKKTITTISQAVTKNITSPTRRRKNSVSHALAHLTWNKEEHKHRETWEINVKEIVFEKVIGAGSCGKVWKGDWHGTPVAVKTFKESIFGTTEQFLLAVQKEVQLMSNLHHPNIVMFLGASVVLPELCMLLEYCDHGCLIDFLVNDSKHKVSISMDLCVKFNIDVARGVKYLHERCNIIQRDLKSRNVLVDNSLNAKLTDFGMSRSIKLQNGEENMSAVGTPAWTAPEIITGEGEYSEKVDVYSFGILMWEILTRSEPYAGKYSMEYSGVQIAFAAANDGLRPDIPFYCPDDYGTLMKRCWAAKPDDRPGFAEILLRLFQMKKNHRR